MPTLRALPSRPAPRPAALRLGAVWSVALLAAVGASAHAALAQTSQVRLERSLAPSALPAARLVHGLCADEFDFRAHVAVLASPWLAGREAGTPGNVEAVGYIERAFAAAGLTPAFGSGEAARYRQRFEFDGRVAVGGGAFEVPGLAFAYGPEADFVASAYGVGGEAEGGLVFVGYAIDNGPRGSREFASFPPGLRLDGKIAVALRFEPMTVEGRSRWTRSGRWSGRAGIPGKVRAVEALGARALVLINPPGADDPRAERLVESAQVMPLHGEIPVLHLSEAAGERLVRACDPERRSLLALRRAADEAALAVDFGCVARLRADVARERHIADNVIGILPGAGALADECVLVCANLDHIGLGDGRSRDPEAAGRVVHPGADENASGTAALLVLAERSVACYADPSAADIPRRTLVFAAFNASEVNQAGSQHYTAQPARPLAAHVLAIDVGPLGRLQDRRLHVQAAWTGEGLAELVAGTCAGTPLTLVQDERYLGPGDYWPFLVREVPILRVRADPHGDLRTPRDTPERLDHAAAIDAIDVVDALLDGAVHRATRFAFRPQER